VDNEIASLIHLVEVAALSPSRGQSLTTYRPATPVATIGD